MMHHRERERGIILIAVLLAVAIMSVMVVAAAALTRSGIGSEELEQRRFASHFAVRSAIEAAKAMILATPVDERVFFDGTPIDIPTGTGGRATISIRDAAGFVDINQSDPALIEAMARDSGLSLGEVNGLAAKITKLRKDATPATAAATAPAAQVVAAAPPAGQEAADQMPAGAGPQPLVFLSVDQLQSLADLTTPEGREFASRLTVFSPSGRINPLAAPAELLQAIPGISPGDLAAFAAAKKSRTWKGAAKAFLALGDPSVFVIDVKLGAGAGLLAGSSARAVVRTGSDKPLPFRTLALEEQ